MTKSWIRFLPITVNIALAPALAAAQEVEVLDRFERGNATDEGGDRSRLEEADGINRAECARGEKWRYAVRVSAPEGGSLYVFAGPDCADFDERGEDDGSCWLLHQERLDDGAAETLDIELSAAEIAGASGSSCEDVDDEVLLHFALATARTAEPGAEKRSGSIRVLGKRPETPTALVTHAGDRAVELEWDQDGDADAAIVLCIAVGADPAASGELGPDEEDGASCIDRAKEAGLEAGNELDRSLRCDADSAFASPLVGTAARIEDLDNEITVALAVVAVDAVGNTSLVSDVVCETPQPVDDFFDQYRAAGGTGGGDGCSVATTGAPGPSGAALVAAALLLVTARRRRRSRRPTATPHPAPLSPLRGARGLHLRPVGGAGSLRGARGLHLRSVGGAGPHDGPQLAGPSSRRGARGTRIGFVLALALVVGVALPARADPREPVPRFAFEAFGSAYHPQVDAGLGGAHPFRDSFGDGDSLRVGLEVGWRGLVTPVGAIGLSLALGHALFEGRGRFSRTGERANDETSLAVYPIVASVVVRLDGAARHWGVPLVPFAKLGLARYGWLADGSGRRSAVDDPEEGRVIGSGHTYGWELQAGVALLLDELDVTRARLLQLLTGIDNSYLYAAWLRSQIDWGTESMNLSDSTWCIGVLIEA